MRLTELIRNKAFWCIDLLKGGKKRSHYNNIKSIIENPNSPESIHSKKQHLQNILEHAINSTEFYKQYSEYNSLEDFPVINKNVIRSHFDGFQSKDFIELPKFTVSTSGSTGTPFKIYQNGGKRIRNMVDTIYFSEKAGFRIGYRLTFFRLWNAFEQKGKITRLLQNIVPVDVFELKAKGKIESIIQDLSSSKYSNSWLGYASAYEDICTYLDQKESSTIPNNLKSVIAISESLNTYTKESIYKYFNTEVVSRYSNVENGIIAQQPLGNKKYFIINDASYVVEILEVDSDNQVEDGKPGRIVITDLFNYSMPMIRYDTGDIGIKGVVDSKAVLLEVRGRKIDQIYNTKGEVVNINIVLLVNKYPELRQCQLIQESQGKYLVKLNSEREFYKEDELLNEFKVYLGEDAIITVEYVDEIPLLASGKRRVMVNQMINS
ncbi:CoF synthetase [Aquimarina sp. MMG016]|uniref:CoF synthetase n=1 Tax=Aquimarina sp. MMG016 TaxID=2822690 RepID=UPI001B3A5336|nr:CoF synthetase [Aquimarina sp. MMG016]MBQ4819555.1 CoF synthetase [Aquimarina sp. MMG016]